MTKGTFFQLKNDVRRIYHLFDAKESGDYDPKLYLKLDYAFKDARKDIEEALVEFKQAIDKQQRQTR